MNNLMSGESIQYQSTLNRFHAFHRSGGIGAISIITLLASGWVFAFFLICTLVAFILDYLHFKNTEFVITNKRVLIRVGFFSKRSLEILLTKVEAIAFQQDMGQRMDGSGDIVISGTGGTREVLANLDNPEAFHRQLQMQIDELQNKKSA